VEVEVVIPAAAVAVTPVVEEVAIPVGEEVAIPAEAEVVIPAAVNPEDKAAAKNTINPRPPMTSSF
jgi:hypothetical protein